MGRYRVRRRIADLSPKRSPAGRRDESQDGDDNTLPVDPAAERSFRRGCMGCSLAFMVLFLFLAGSLLFSRCNG